MPVSNRASLYMPSPASVMACRLGRMRCAAQRAVLLLPHTFIANAAEPNEYLNLPDENAYQARSMAAMHAWCQQRAAEALEMPLNADQPALVL